jgi:ribosomal protein S18 acetylase RimI-like enzyme
MMILRLAESQDIEAICALYEAFYLYNADMQPEYYQETPEIGHYPSSVIKSDKGDIFVAVENGEIIGFIHLEEEKTPPYHSVVQHSFAAIVDLFVKPGHRRKGIGNLLLDQAKKWASERTLDYIELYVLDNNAPGIRFYEQENFRTVSRTMRYTL